MSGGDGFAIGSGFDFDFVAGVGDGCGLLNGLEGGAL